MSETGKRSWKRAVENRRRYAEQRRKGLKDRPTALELLQILVESGEWNRRTK